MTVALRRILSVATLNCASLLEESASLVADVLATVANEVAPSKPKRAAASVTAEKRELPWWLRRPPTPPAHPARSEPERLS